MILSLKSAVHGFMYDKCIKDQWNPHEGEIYSSESNCYVRELSDEQLKTIAYKYFHNAPVTFVADCTVDEFLTKIVAEIRKHINDADGSDIYDSLRSFEK